MLNIKKLLTKLCGRVNYRQVRVDATTTTQVAANGGTAWAIVPLQDTGTAVSISGCYLLGGGTCTVYAQYLTSSGGQIALRNYGDAVQNVTPALYYLVVD